MTRLSQEEQRTDGFRLNKFRLSRKGISQTSRLKPLIVCPREVVTAFQQLRRPSRRQKNQNSPDLYLALVFGEANTGNALLKFRVLQPGIQRIRWCIYVAMTSGRQCFAKVLAGIHWY